MPPTCSYVSRHTSVLRPTPKPSLTNMPSTRVLFAPRHSSSASRAGVGRRALVISAVFERFTERSIKTVLLAQQECRSLGTPEVGRDRSWGG